MGVCPGMYTAAGIRALLWLARPAGSASRRLCAYNVFAKQRVRQANLDGDTAESAALLSAGYFENT